MADYMSHSVGYPPDTSLWRQIPEWSQLLVLAKPTAESLTRSQSTPFILLSKNWLSIYLFPNTLLSTLSTVSNTAEKGPTPYVILMVKVGKNQ